MLRQIAAQELGAALDSDDFYDQWLAVVQAKVTGLVNAVVVMAEHPNQGPFLPMAFFPAKSGPPPALAAVCEQVLDMRAQVARRSAQGSLLGLPVLLDGDLLGVVAFAAPELDDTAVAWLHWGLGWLLVHHARRQGQSGEHLRERLLLTLDLTMGVLSEPGFAAASNRLVTDAAVRLGCDRVVVGLGDGDFVKVLALSHSAEFTRRVDLTHALEAALNEAAEQGVPICLEQMEPVQADVRLLTTREHQRLVRDFGSGAALSVPFSQDQHHMGVFLFEWSSPTVPEGMRELAEGMAPILGRILLDRRHAERSVWKRIRDATRDEVQKLLGPMQTTRKLVALALATIMLFFAVAHGDHRVSAAATLEGTIRRTIVAPFDGFVAMAEVRAGQEVQAGDVLATLDDRDLRLEVQRWSSQEEQFRRQARDAEAQFLLAQIQIARAQTDQATAQRELSESQLARAQIRAPFDALVVEGDLSQQLGGAVRKGQTLFELAPLDAYRVVLEVQESDISRIAVGQQGHLVVTALTEVKFPFTVSLITPVASASDGQNYFRVEASLDEHGGPLRPGMQGIAKIVVGERRLIWIWTHRMMDWFRLQAWKWLGL